MAQSPETITVEAELILRYPSGKETKLGDVQIEQFAHYQYSFTRTDEPLPPTAVTESYARIEGAAK